MAGSIKRVLHVGCEPYKAEDEIWKLNLVPYAKGKKKFPPEDAFAGYLKKKPGK
jgi:hypothetical protein